MAFEAPKTAVRAAAKRTVQPQRLASERARENRELIPNSGLVEAIEEGRTLKGRSNSAKDLFDALEKDGQD